MNVYVAEFIGTALLLLLGNGVVANVCLKKTLGNNGGWIVITAGWALAVFTGVLVAAPHSGAHLNPAVTVGLAIGGLFDWAMAPGYIMAQFGGAFTGALLTWAMYRDHFNSTEDPAAQLGVFSTGAAIKNPFTNLLSEIIGTFVLIFAVFYIAGATLDPDGTSTPIGLGTIGAIPVAFVVWAIGLSLGGTTGYAINPARDLAPRIFHAIAPIKGKGGSNWGYAWVPVVGPIIGAALAAALYLLVKH
ncbi:MIP/aquaporin family protein [Parapedobacter tibetensis]|uniref:MIP/aquaporin family protein n=1 Tax=Parapedobacter tibetensis TaxID=2972951 RepID=UPI00214D1D6B|nr:MIP/aquaporin family protein [Parapedobacter tibetensis]